MALFFCEVALYQSILTHDISQILMFCPIIVLSGQLAKVHCFNYLIVENIFHSLKSHLKISLNPTGFNPLTKILNEPPNILNFCRFSK